MQTKTHSILETITGTIVGFAIAVGLQFIIFPWYGYEPKLGSAYQIAFIYTVASIIRSYLIRRSFNILTERRIIALQAKSWGIERMKHESYEQFKFRIMMKVNATLLSEVKQK